MESPWKKEGRLPAPSPSVVDVKTGEIRTVFEGEFDSGGEALFAKLLKLAMETRGQDPAAAFVCLWEASRTAAKAGQIDLSFGTLAGLERWYEIDARLLPMQLEVLALCERAARSNEHKALALVYAVRLIDFAESRRDFESGAKLVALANTLVRNLRSGDILHAVQTRISHFEAFKEAYHLAEAARQQLAGDPKNAQAHWTVGRFMTVFDEDWSEDSLTHLAAGSDASFAAAAQLELAGPATPTSQVAVGDAWWELAEKRVRSVRSRSNRTPLHGTNGANRNWAHSTAPESTNALSPISRPRVQTSPRQAHRDLHVVSGSPAAPAGPHS